MPIVHHAHGSTSITGKTSISYFRLATLLAGLRFEVKTGMQITRGPSAYSIVKRECGFKGNKAKVLEQFEAYVAAMKTQVEIIDEKGEA
jgi:hypothetical protein